jgi:hypothetical protein
VFDTTLKADVWLHIVQSDNACSLRSIHRRYAGSLSCRDPGADRLAAPARITVHTTLCRKLPVCRYWRPVRLPSGDPSTKVRGSGYLGVIYGPHYTEPANLDRQPLWRVHKPVFAVLALESESVDPRL